MSKNTTPPTGTSEPAEGSQGLHMATGTPRSVPFDVDPSTSTRGGRRPRMNPNTIDPVINPASMLLTDADDAAVAWMALRAARDGLRAAQCNALMAVLGLEGARRSRAQELARIIADGQAYAERLAFVVEGDIRTAQAEGRLGS